MKKRDYSELLGRMKSRGITQEALAKSVGISETTMNLALNGKRQFRQAEMLAICKELEIPVGDIPAYFFAGKLLKLEV